MSPRFSSIGALLNASVIGIALAILAGVIWVSAVGYLRGVIRPERPRSADNEFVAERVEFLRDGTPVIRGSSPQSKREHGQEFRDLEGEEVLEEVRDRRGGLMGNTTLRAPSQLTNWGLTWGSRIMTLCERGESPVFWFFVHDGRRVGRGYFVGYEVSLNARLRVVSAGSTRVGFIGTSGFREDGVPEEEQFQVSTYHAWTHYCSINQRFLSKLTLRSVLYPFSYDMGVGREETDFIETQVYLHAEDAVYRIDVKKRTTHKLIDVPPEGIVSMGFLDDTFYYTPSDRELDRRVHVLLRTSKEILVMGPRGELQQRVTLPEKLCSAEELTFFKSMDDQFFATDTERKWENGQFHLRSHLYKFDANGNVLWSRDVELPTNVKRQEMHWEAAYFWLMAAPLSADFGFLFIAPFEGMRGERSYLESIRAACEDLSQSGLGNPYLLVPLLHLYTLLWAWLVWRRETKYAASPGQRKMWSVFVYLFGLPALLGYLAHRKWPLLENCPSCSISTPVDHDTCRSCGTEWPLPSRKGIEVLG